MRVCVPRQLNPRALQLQRSNGSLARSGRRCPSPCSRWSSRRSHHESLSGQSNAVLPSLTRKDNMPISQFPSLRFAHLYRIQVHVKLRTFSMSSVIVPVLLHTLRAATSEACRCRCCCYVLLPMAVSVSVRKSHSQTRIASLLPEKFIRRSYGNVKCERRKPETSIDSDPIRFTRVIRVASGVVGGPIWLRSCQVNPKRGMIVARALTRSDLIQ